MSEEKSIYIAIDLKSFHASVECIERRFDPMTTNLVAVSPSLKACGVPGRPRLFEVITKVKEVNAKRLYRAPNRKFKSESYVSKELINLPQTAISYILASPRKIDDEYEETVVKENGREIFVSNILEINCGLFSTLGYI